ncbi:MAG: hypothetical protein NC217_00045 [Muribaculaceae bacterium]|nr:hypothetical protein [Muribaculaceae bacterium]
MIDYDQLTDLAGMDALSDFVYLNIPDWPCMLPQDNYLGVENDITYTTRSFDFFKEERTRYAHAHGWFQANRCWTPQFKSNNPNGYIF